MSDDRFERMVREIMLRSRAELARRAASRVTPFDVVAAWSRPALAAAAVIAVVSVTLLATFERRDQEIFTGAYMSGAEVPAAMSSWYEEDRLPTAAELMVVTNQEAANGSVR